MSGLKLTLIVGSLFLSACAITVENYDIVYVCTGDIEVGELFEKIIKYGEDKKDNE